MKKNRFLTCVAFVLLLVICLNVIACDEVSRKEDGREEKKTDRGPIDLMEDITSSKTEPGEDDSSKREEHDTEAHEADSSRADEAGTELPEVELDEVVKVTDFALDLFSASEETGKNTLISPLSVLCALSMTLNGAVGETREQMESVLGMSADELNIFIRSYVKGLPQGEKYKLALANSIWFRDDETFSVNGDFLQTNADYYGADIYKAPFDESTLNNINDWVKNETDGMIEKVLEEIPPEAIMYLINALAFDAEWMNVYYESAVRDGKFTCEDGTVRDTQMMHGEDGFYLEDDMATGFVKLYSGSKYAFVALLPNEGVSVSEYVTSLNGEAFQSMLDGARSDLFLYTSMPKFTVEYDVEMSEILKGMGMVNAFDSGRADFSALGTSEMGNIFINRVIHKTFIEVGEQGTRAGAVTVVEMFPEGCAPFDEVKYVYLDRPFVYMLVDWENKIPFFIGTLMDVDQ